MTTRVIRPPLSENDIAFLRSYTSAAEEAGQLLPQQLKLIHERKWFNLYNPPTWNGPGWALPDAVRFLESLAYADGSVGWVVTLCSGAAMFAGYFEENLRNEIIATNDMCIAGSGLANGVAKKTDDGYIVTGHWPYASGARHATHFTANCVVDEETTPEKNIRSFVFTREEVRLHRQWKYIGLNATGGDAFSVEELKVPVQRAFDIGSSPAIADYMVYRYPFLQFAEATLAVNTAGMCKYFVELIKPYLLKHGSSTRAVELLHSFENQINVARETFYSSVDLSWNKLSVDGGISARELTAVSRDSKAMAATCRECVDRLYPYGGLEMARPDTIVNQVWRNIHTASQHSLLLK